jgi:hypothetical protein
MAVIAGQVGGGAGHGSQSQAPAARQQLFLVPRGARPDDLQPQPAAEDVAQPASQVGVVDEQVQALGVLGEQLGQFAPGLGLARLGQLHPADDAAQVAVAVVVGDQRHGALPP